jgi:hypothetical protein
MTNVLAELAQYVNEVRERLNRPPVTPAGPFARYLAEQAVKTDAKYHTSATLKYDGDGSASSLVSWIYNMEEVARACEAELSFGTWQDEYIAAEFDKRRLFTDEERIAARKWLEENPYQPTTIMWRRPVPFSNIHDGWVDKAD